MLWWLLSVGCSPRAPIPPPAASAVVPEVTGALVFTTDLPANTVLDGSHVEREPYPEGLRSPHWPSFDDAMGKVLTTSVARGMPVDARRLSDVALPTRWMEVAADATSFVVGGDRVRFVQRDGMMGPPHRVFERSDEGLLLADEGQAPPEGLPVLVGRRDDEGEHGVPEPLWRGCVAAAPADRTGWLAVARSALVPRLGLEVQHIMYCPGEVVDVEDPEGPELAVVRALYPGEVLSYGVLDAESLAYPPPASLKLPAGELAVAVVIPDLAMPGLHYDVLVGDEVLQALSCVSGWVGGATLLRVASAQAATLLFADEPLLSSHRDSDDLGPQPEATVRARVQNTNR